MNHTSRSFPRSAAIRWAVACAGLLITCALTPFIAGRAAPPDQPEGPSTEAETRDLPENASGSGEKGERKDAKSAER